MSSLNYALRKFLHLAYRTYFDNKGTAARLTVKRFFVMSSFLPPFFVLLLVHFVALALDNVFFNGYQNIPVKRPLFIIGVPRSGTTYLHRILAGDTQRFTTFALWELVFAPAIVEKKLWIGLSKFDRKVGRPLAKIVSLVMWPFTHSLKDIHRISLTVPEEDFLLLAPVFACFLLVIPFPFEEIWQLAYFDERMKSDDKARIMSFYKSCLQRHLYVFGKDRQLLSKNASFVPLIDSVRKTFPDCRIISTVRNPLEVVPSQISTLLPGARFFDNDTSHPLFRDRFVDLLKHYYRQLITQLPPLPRTEYIIIHMGDIKEHLESVVVNIYRHFGHELPETFMQNLHREAKLARSYKSKHHYSLEMFGLNRETILTEFSFACDFFDF